MRPSSIASASFALAALCSPAFAQNANEDQLLLPADPQQNGWFGYSISIDGGRAVIGSPLKDDVGGASGATYLFERFGPSAWVETAKLAPNLTLEQGDLFGASVSISGGRIAVGMVGEDDAALNAGATVIFDDFGGGLWFESAKLFASDAQPGDFFGEPLVLDANRVVIGSQFDADNGAESGSAYVFENQAGVWTEVAKLKPLDGVAMDHFGASIDFEGDRVLIGAADNDDGFQGAGSAYAFERLPNGMWRQSFKFVAPDPFTNDNFGWAVSLDGDFAYISSVGQDFPGVVQGGEVYVFQRISLGNWQLITRFNAATPVVNGFFGTNIDVEGARAVTTAWAEGATDSAAYVHDLQSGGTWLQAARVHPTDVAASDTFGRALAIDGNEALIGSINADNPFTDGGKAYELQLGTLYHGAPTISSAVGGTQDLLIRAGTSKANQVFVLLGSASGTFPGTFDALSGVTVPLNFDAYFLQLLNTGGAGLLSPFFGFLDANGSAAGAFTIPPVNASFIGTSLHHGCVFVDIFGTTLASGASNPVRVTIVP